MYRYFIKLELKISTITLHETFQIWIGINEEKWDEDSGKKWEHQIGVLTKIIMTI